MSTHLSAGTEPVQTAEGAWLAHLQHTPEDFNPEDPFNAALIEEGKLAKVDDGDGSAPLAALADDELAEWFKGKKLPQIIEGVGDDAITAGRLIVLEQAKAEPREPVLEALAAVGKDPS